MAVNRIATMNSDGPPRSAGAQTTSSLGSSATEGTNETSFHELNSKETNKGGRHGGNILGEKENGTEYKHGIDLHKNSGGMDYFNSNFFSRSFNSLMLDDLDDEKDKRHRARGLLYKSPSFNVKEDYYSSLHAYGQGGSGEGREMDDDEDIEAVKQDFIFAPSGPKNSSATAKEKATKDPSKNSKSNLWLKRSSKSLNLSIDSSIGNRDMHKVSDLSLGLHSSRDKELIGSESGLDTQPKQVKEEVPSEIKFLDITQTPFNKHKRPHKLVSPSPSPISNEQYTSRFASGDDKSAQYTTKPFAGQGDTGIDTDSKTPLLFPILNQSAGCSPSKLSTKGLKMLKSSENFASISPNHIDKNKLPRNYRGNSEYTISHSKPTSVTNKALLYGYRNYVTKKSKTPFTSSFSKSLNLMPPAQEEFDLMDIDDDSPSRTRRRTGALSPILHGFEDKENDFRENALKIPDSVSDTWARSSLTGRDDSSNGLKSYQFVRPLQTAFRSTGLIKKNSDQSIEAKTKKLPPETPMKRHPLAPINDFAVNRLDSCRGRFYSHKVKEHEKDHYDTYATSFENTDPDVSIEIGRNKKVNLPEDDNDSTISLFKDESAQKYNHGEKDLLPEDLDIDLTLGDSIPDTPTKSVKKSNSTPANYSPGTFKNSKEIDYTHGENINPRIKKLREMKPLSSLAFPKINIEEPSTPTDSIVRKNFAYYLNAKDILHSKSLSSSQNKVSGLDDHLISKFGIKNLKFLGLGEFSAAFECSFQDQKYAIKKTKRPVIGKLDRQSILNEIEALRALSSVKDNELVNFQEQEEGKDNLVYFIEAWEFNNYFYIMTEYCEGGTLDGFLEENKNYKIDEFRVWKILIEILSGLKFIHLKNYIHLDVKPENIFITFEGYLKIGDFGLATKLPIVDKDFDKEGDRNYIAPELLNEKTYTPFADVFSVGLIILEIAANIVLPDNGSPWRKLRSGDLSDAGKLSSDNISDYLQHQNVSSLSSYTSLDSTQQRFFGTQKPFANKPANMLHLIPSWAPDFLVSPESDNLDVLVGKMLRPSPFERPSAKEILQMPECVVIENRRKAGATIFEGEFGPGNDE